MNTEPHYMTVAGIATKYHPATGRISARRLDHKTGDPIAYLNSGNYSDSAQAHAECAKLLIKKMECDWTINPIGAFDNDRYIWTAMFPHRDKIQSIIVIGKQWHDRVNGNTYCSADVIVDGKTYKTAYTYGYGDFYMQSANEILKRHGVIDTPGNTPLWEYCSNNGIRLNRYVMDCKKCDLNQHETVDA